jgi:GTP-binding protein LepA
MTNNIRNFCIIAHIDHGKSTLADRMLEMTGTVKKVAHGQMLDRLDIEQERGITIKLTPARMQWKGYSLNLIDTPGHVDFAYEVSRSLAAVEGAILLVDASQGVQAQTLSVLYQAMDNGLEIIPVLNKIDLPAANPERVAKELEHLLGVDPATIIKISGKTGENVDAVLDAVIERLPDPKTFLDAHPKKYRESGVVHDGLQARALIFDSVYDPYKGVVCYVKMVAGSIAPGQKIMLPYSENTLQPIEVGHFTPEYAKDPILSEGHIGYVVTGGKSVREAKIGDTMLTVTGDDTKKSYDQLLEYTVPGFKRVKPYVYAWVFPVDNSDFEAVREAFSKLSLNDSALEYEYENSKALGYGMRAGFLGMLHMDIIKERLSREYNVETIFTIPNVAYLVSLKSYNDDRVVSGSNITDLVKSWLYIHIITDFSGKLSPEDAEFILHATDHAIMVRYQDKLKNRLLIRSGADMPMQGYVDEMYEPFADVEVVGPKEYSGNIMALAQEYRGELRAMEYIDELRVLWRYRMPLGELIIDFYDKLKSATKGYATMNYEFAVYACSDLVKLDILLNNELVEAFSQIVHRDKAYPIGRDTVEKLKEFIPKQMFTIPIQAGVWSKIIARETISAMRKDVIAKCYGGDVSRKRKLLQKQKEGKKRMKSMGSVEVPSDIFLKMVTRN